MPPLPGGLMQLIAYGAQDLYLTGNPHINTFDIRYLKRIHNPLSLQDMCLTCTSKKEKDYLCSRKEAFPYMFNKLTQDIRHKKDYFIRDLNYLFTNEDYLETTSFPLSILCAGSYSYFKNYRYIMKRYQKYKDHKLKLKRQILTQRRQQTKMRQLRQQPIIKAMRDLKRLNYQLEEDYEFELDF